MAALAERCASPELLARAALVYGTELASGTVDPQMVALLRGSLQALPAQDSSLRARVMARLSASLTPPQRYPDTIDMRFETGIFELKSALPFPEVYEPNVNTNTPLRRTTPRTPL